MKWDFVSYALNNLKGRRLRSWLTILSILIGITMIFTLISFGQGLSKYVTDLSDEIGADKLIAQAGGFSAGVDSSFYFTQDEVDAFSKVKGVAEVSPYSIGGVSVESDDKKIYAFGVGISTDRSQLQLLEESFGSGIYKGRQLRKGDKFEAVLGYNYQIPNKVFKSGVDLGEKILINDMKFEVVGFFEEVGNAQDDTNVYLTYDGFNELYPDQKDEFGVIIARTAAGENPEEVALKAEDEIRDMRGQEEGEEDFYVQTFLSAIEVFTNILNVINAILVLIALISVVVAGVNIMNTMYTAVMERTKEIGVMKAIGAKNSSILIIFVLESGVLGVIGAAIGIVLGWIIATIGGKIAANAGYALLTPIFPAWLIIGCLLFGFVLGSGAGMLPARQAARQKPVDALRYE